MTRHMPVARAPRPCVSSRSTGCQPVSGGIPPRSAGTPAEKARAQRHDGAPTGIGAVSLRSMFRGEYTSTAREYAGYTGYTGYTGWKPVLRKACT